MSLSVRCPGCDARLRASEDQLRAARGWVRCGHCQQSFDAASQAAASAARASAERAPLLQRVSSDTQRNAPQTGPATHLSRESLVQRAAHEKRPLPRPAAAAAAPSATTPAFLREASSQPASGRSVGWRAFGRLAAVGLAVLLLAQVLMQQRDWLAARAPATAPMLGRACALLGCVIAPPREIDALVISNSSLTRTGSDSYRLSLAVKNQSDLKLAMPGIELSLLDPAERTVLRRVLLARDVGADAALEPFGEWIGAVHFDLPDAQSRVAGYRVLTFYP